MPRCCEPTAATPERGFRRSQPFDGLRTATGEPYASPVEKEHRELGLAAAIAIVVGESIALGIFLTPAGMARSLGSPLLLGAVWCGMALMAFCGALCFA